MSFFLDFEFTLIVDIECSGHLICTDDKIQYELHSTPVQYKNLYNQFRVDRDLPRTITICSYYIKFAMLQKHR